MSRESKEPEGATDDAELLGVPVDEAERANAEALARALEGRAPLRRSSGAAAEGGAAEGGAAEGGAGVPLDRELEVAALFRVRARWELEPDRKRQIGEELRASALRGRPESRRDRRAAWWAWLSVPALALGAWLVLKGGPDVAPFAPPSELLRAQADVIRTVIPRQGETTQGEQPGARVRYERALGEYRGELLAALQERYEP